MKKKIPITTYNITQYTSGYWLHRALCDWCDVSYTTSDDDILKIIKNKLEDKLFIYDNRGSIDK